MTSFLAAENDISQYSHHDLFAYCEPETAFLRRISSTFGTCIPTQLALLSTSLGCLSILSWLFAQLPQIFKNQRMRSTSGLSVSFLAIWLLGDLSNLLGCLFTGQALWQMVVAAYYVSVDCVLVGQWVWFERLRHGRPMFRVWTARDDNSSSGAGDNGTTGKGIIRGITVDGWSKSWGDSDSEPSRPGSPDLKSLQRSIPRDMLRRPAPENSESSSSAGSFSGRTLTGTPSGRPTIHRISPFSMSSSPRTMLLITFVLAVLARGSPVHPSTAEHPTYTTLSTADDSPSATAAAGAILSWLSTFLYLGSRLPQFIKNQRRRSTAGLSATLFIAAFFGNLFYSSSLLANPCAWHSFGPHGGRGWVGAPGSDRADWVARAAPFWLGAAGVLALDAAVGVQFWVYGDGEAAEDAKRAGEAGDVVLVREGKAKRWRWARVHGWMRGWVPSAAEVRERVGRRREVEALLADGSGEGGYGAA